MNITPKYRMKITIYCYLQHRLETIGATISPAKSIKSYQLEHKNLLQTHTKSSQISSKIYDHQINRQGILFRKILYIILTVVTRQALLW